VDSLVVIFLPAAADTGVKHERIGAPSRCTVQAPQSAMPQPNFVPVMPSESRSTQRMGVSASTSAWSCLPLTCRGIIGVFLALVEAQRCHFQRGMSITG